jgi:transposase InsO family protein
MVSWTGYSQDRILDLFSLSHSTFFGWFDESGNLVPPKDRKPSNPKAVLKSEIEAVIKYRLLHKDVGYRKLTWMMIDENICCLTESATYEILKKHNMLYGWNSIPGEPAKKEYTEKPKHVHDHWHTDIAYIKIAGVFYFLIMVLDGHSRFLLGWDLMTDMMGKSVEDFIQRVKEKYPFAKPKLIHDNGGQFISHDFKRLITTLDMQQIRTRRNHPQTNGKIERMNGTVKNEAIRPNCPTDYQEAWEILNAYCYTYNYQRLHAGIKFMRPADLFFNREKSVGKERKDKLNFAKKIRVETNVLGTVQ